ncbi:MAG: hypothetical protein AAFQ73_03765 [Pseudomonadota bacterium]
MSLSDDSSSRGRGRPEPGFASMSDEAPRSRRSVIVDDSYDGAFEFPQSDDPLSDAGFSNSFQDPPPAATSSRRATGAKKPLPVEKTAPVAKVAPAREQTSGGAGIWVWACFLSLVWVSAVCAFAIGYHQLPANTPAALLDAFETLPASSLTVIGALAIGPLAFLWMTALQARRARDLRIEARRLAELTAQLTETSALAGLGGGHTSRGAHGLSAAASGLDPSSIQAEIDRATRSVSDLQLAISETERGVAETASRLESQRVALQSLLEEIRAEAGPLNALTGGQGGGEMTARMSDTLLSLERAAARLTELSSGANSATRSGEGPTARENAATAAHAPLSQAEARAAANVDSASDEDQSPGQIEELKRQLDRLRTQTARSRDNQADVGMAGNESVAAKAPARTAARDVQAQVSADEANLVSPAKRGSSGLDWTQFIRAANFPDSEEDRDTLDALYAVLSDRDAANLLQTAEDALSGLADIGLFMEDLKPHHADAAAWRSYLMDKNRTNAIDLGGIRNADAIEDTITAFEDRSGFNETAERFLDRYESMASRLMVEAADPSLVVELADTRTGRAFMLLGRASGRFG